DDEDVLAATFRHITVDIEHDRFVIARFLDFGFGQDGVDVIPRRLALGHHHVHVVASIRGYLRTDAILDSLIAEISPPWPNRDANVDGIIRRIKSHVAYTQKNQGPDVTFLTAIC